MKSRNESSLTHRLLTAPMTEAVAGFFIASEVPELAGQGKLPEAIGLMAVSAATVLHGVNRFDFDTETIQKSTEEAD